jgi:cholesterol transport system auxiliary component
MSTPHRIAAGCAALLLSGCSLLGGSRNAPSTFAPEVAAAADPAWPQVDWQLAIARPTAPRVLDSSRIAVSPVPGELQVYKGARWAHTAPEMLEQGVLRTLEDSGRLPAVARLGSGIVGDYRLVMDIRRFEADYAGAALPSAVVEVSATLLHGHDPAVVASRVFRQTQAASGNDPGRVADAFSQALRAASGEIAGWVLASGQAHEASHSDSAR